MSSIKNLLAATLLFSTFAVMPLASWAAEPAASVPMPFLGGALDPSITGAEVYLGVPAPAEIPTSCRLAATYAELLDSQQYDRVSELFAEDAFLIGPMPNVRAFGRKEIDKFYRTVGETMRPHPVAVHYVAGPNECLQVHANRRAIEGRERYVVTAIAYFTLNSQGKFASMVAFSRPRTADFPPPWK